MDVLHDAALRHSAGRLFTEDLPEVAVQALGRGIDSSSLRELAGLNRHSDPVRIRDLYQATLEELGIQAPSALDAVRHLQRELAEALVTESISPEQASRGTSPGEAWMTEREWNFAYLAYYRDEYADLTARSGTTDYDKDLHAAALALLDDPAGT